MRTLCSFHLKSVSHLSFFLPLGEDGSHSGEAVREGNGTGCRDGSARRRWWSVERILSGIWKLFLHASYLLIDALQYSSLPIGCYFVLFVTVFTFLFSPRAIPFLIYGYFISNFLIFFRAANISNSLPNLFSWSDAFAQPRFRFPLRRVFE